MFFLFQNKMKRACLNPKPVSCDAFDVEIHPLYPHVEVEMPLLVDVRCNTPSQSKEYPIALIILADVSGSMLQGSKIHNMREAIIRLGELSARFSTIKIDLTLIEFNDEARVVHSSMGMPSAEALQKMCQDLAPYGGTNIGAALEMAVDSIPTDTAVHVALFTDGEDNCNLLERLESANVPYLTALQKMSKMWLHCVGICADFDCK